MITRLNNFCYLTAVGLVFLSSMVSHSSAITCYNFTSMDGKFSSASTVNGCLACMRYTTFYNSAAIKYTMYQWACSLQPSTGMTAPSSSSNTPQCIASTTVVTYADRSLYNKACTCCTNLCNLENFCQPTPNESPDSPNGKCNRGSSSSQQQNSLTKIIITILASFAIFCPPIHR